MSRANIFARCTTEDHQRVSKIQERHELARCEFVEMMRDVSRDAYWYDASPYEGDKHRFSAHFNNPLGPQTVCGGAESRPTEKNNFDQSLRAWTMVTGEFHTRV